MPTFMIENISPLIQYLPPGAWKEGDKIRDPEASRYSGNSSFTLTTNVGATAQFNFTGTSIFIGGAKRDNHGSYTVVLDGETSTLNGFSSDPMQFQAPLFKADGLTPGEHTITISNRPQSNRSFLDIDFIQWESLSAEDAESSLLDSTVTTMKDNDFSYEPEDAWFTDMTALPGFLNNTGHATKQDGAKVTVNFEGTGISLFSAVGPDQGSYSASLDSGPASTYSTVKADYYPNQMIYHADRLPPGKHNVELVRLPGGQYLSVDYALVYETDYDTLDSSFLSKGAIAGIIISVLLFIVLMMTALYFLIKSRIRRAKDGSDRNAPAEALPRPIGPKGQANDRISAWREETLAATMHLPQIGDSPPSMVSYEKDGGNSTVNHLDIPWRQQDKRFSTAASLANPRMTGTSSLFSVFRKTQPMETGSPRFGQKVGKGKKFVNLDV